MTAFFSSALNMQRLLLSPVLLTLSGVLHTKMVNPLLNLMLHPCNLQITLPCPQDLAFGSQDLLGNASIIFNTSNE